MRIHSVEDAAMAKGPDDLSAGRQSSSLVDGEKCGIFRCSAALHQGSRSQGVRVSGNCSVGGGVPGSGSGSAAAPNGKTSVRWRNSRGYGRAQDSIRTFCQISGPRGIVAWARRLEYHPNGSFL